MAYEFANDSKYAEGNEKAERCECAPILWLLRLVLLPDQHHVEQAREDEGDRIGSNGANNVENILDIVYTGRNSDDASE